MGAVFLAGCSRFTSGSEEWKLLEETDKLTNKKTTYLGYHSANVESKVYCNKYHKEYIIESGTSEGGIKITVDIVIPDEFLTIFDTTQPILKRERDYDGGVKNFLFSRSIYNNELEYTIGYYQSNQYYNKFNRAMINPRQTLQKFYNEGRREDFGAGMNEYHMSVVPKSTEILMNDGSSHVIKYNDDFQKHIKKCIENQSGEFL